MNPYRLCWLTRGILSLSTKKICHFTTISEEITLSIQHLTLNKCFHNHASSCTAADFSKLLPTDSTRKPTVWQDHILRVRKTVSECACVCVYLRMWMHICWSPHFPSEWTVFEIRSENQCAPRDVMQVGDKAHLLFCLSPRVKLSEAAEVT